MNLTTATAPPPDLDARLDLCADAIARLHCWPPDGRGGACPVDRAAAGCAGDGFCYQRPRWADEAIAIWRLDARIYRWAADRRAC